jgi:hypothetical protein
MGYLWLDLSSLGDEELAGFLNTVMEFIIIIIIIFIDCNWVVTLWQWLFNTYTKHEIGVL